jgi:hypothetical protein
MGMLQRPAAELKPGGKIESTDSPVVPKRGYPRKTHKRLRRIAAKQGGFGLVRLRRLGYSSNYIIKSHYMFKYSSTKPNNFVEFQ